MAGKTYGSNKNRKREMRMKHTLARLHYRELPVKPLHYHIYDLLAGSIEGIYTTEEISFVRIERVKEGTHFGQRVMSWREIGIMVLAAGNDTHLP